MNFLAYLFILGLSPSGYPRLIFKVSELRHNSIRAHTVLKYSLSHQSLLPPLGTKILISFSVHPMEVTRMRA